MNADRAYVESALQQVQAAQHNNAAIGIMLEEVVISLAAMIEIDNKASRNLLEVTPEECAAMGHPDAKSVEGTLGGPLIDCERCNYVGSPTA